MLMSSYTENILSNDNFPGSNLSCAGCNDTRFTSSDYFKLYKPLSRSDSVEEKRFYGVSSSDNPYLNSSNTKSEITSFLINSSESLSKILGDNSTGEVTSRIAPITGISSPGCWEFTPNYQMQTISSDLLARENTKSIHSCNISDVPNDFSEAFTANKREEFALTPDFGQHTRLPSTWGYSAWDGSSLPRNCRDWKNSNFDHYLEDSFSKCIPDQTWRQRTSSDNGRVSPSNKPSAVFQRADVSSDRRRVRTVSGSSDFNAIRLPPNHLFDSSDFSCQLGEGLPTASCPQNELRLLAADSTVSGLTTSFFSPPGSNSMLSITPEFSVKNDSFGTALGFVNIDPSHATNQSSLVMGDEHLWLYEDPQGQIQGEFTDSQMYSWLMAGRYFTSELRIRRKCDDTFSTLIDYSRLFGRIPFTAGPRVPPITGNVNIFNRILLNLHPQRTGFPLFSPIDFKPVTHHFGIPSSQAHFPCLNPSPSQQLAMAQEAVRAISQTAPVCGSFTGPTEGAGADCLQSGPINAAHLLVLRQLIETMRLDKVGATSIAPLSDLLKETPSMAMPPNASASFDSQSQPLPSESLVSTQASPQVPSLEEFPTLQESAAQARPASVYALFASTKVTEEDASRDDKSSKILSHPQCESTSPAKRREASLGTPLDVPCEERGFSQCLSPAKAKQRHPPKAATSEVSTAGKRMAGTTEKRQAESDGKRKPKTPPEMASDRAVTSSKRASNSRKSTSGNGELLKLIQWVREALTGMDLLEQLDIPTFVEVLTAIDEPHMVETMLFTYLDHSTRSKEFVGEFLEKRHACWLRHHKQREEFASKKGEHQLGPQNTTRNDSSQQNDSDYVYADPLESQTESPWQQIKSKNASNRKVKKAKQHS